MNNRSEPAHISESLPHAVGDVNDPARAREVRLRDSASEVQGLEIDRHDVAEAAQNGDPGAEAALEGLTKSLLDAQADHFEYRRQSKPPQ